VGASLRDQWGKCFRTSPLEEDADCTKRNNIIVIDGKIDRNPL
jgi:hypothetical protein